jgi:hypothetical protein
MSAEYPTCATLLKALRTRRKPAYPNQIIFFSNEKTFNQYQKTKGQIALF